MKVLSIYEPWASLIKEKCKYIETRSWKTNYRGELYIHASKRIVNMKDKESMKLLALLDNTNFQYGCIIAKCTLVDCIFMDEEYIEKIKMNDVEYMCGEYSYGRYAWILQDIEPLEEAIHARGSLNIWEYNI